MDFYFIFLFQSWILFATSLVPLQQKAQDNVLHMAFLYKFRLLQLKSSKLKFMSLQSVNSRWHCINLHDMTWQLKLSISVESLGILGPLHRICYRVPSKSLHSDGPLSASWPYALCPLFFPVTLPLTLHTYSLYNFKLIQLNMLHILKCIVGIF